MGPVGFGTYLFVELAEGSVREAEEVLAIWVVCHRGSHRPELIRIYPSFFIRYGLEAGNLESLSLLDDLDQ